MAGLHTTRIGFFRTPKLVEGHSLRRAIGDVREEALFALALLLAALAIGARDDAYLADTRLWIALLLVQSVPYVSAVLVSMISTFQTLPSRVFSNSTGDTLLGRMSSTLLTTDQPEVSHAPRQ